MCASADRSRTAGTGCATCRSKKTHRYRKDNGVQIQAMLRSLAINALRLDGLGLMIEGIAAKRPLRLP